MKLEEPIFSVIHDPVLMSLGMSVADREAKQIDDLIDFGLCILGHLLYFSWVIDKEEKP